MLNWRLVIYGPVDPTVYYTGYCTDTNQHVTETMHRKGMLNKISNLFVSTEDIANLQISPEFPVHQKKSGWLYIGVVVVVGCGRSYAEVRDENKHVCN